MKAHGKLNFLVYCLCILLLIGITAIGTILNKSVDRPVDTQEYPIQARVSDYQIAEIKDDTPYYDINLDKKWQKLIYELCEKNNLDYRMVLSFFEYESEGFKLDLICYNRDGKGRILSYDSGIAQINSKYVEDYRQHAIKYCDLDKDVKFDPLNPDYGIRAGIGGLAYYREYWMAKGITDEETLFHYCLNSYNRGAVDYENYVRNTGNISRSYDREIFRRKESLETEGKFN